MSAMYWVGYETKAQPGVRRCGEIHAADARSGKRAHVSAAFANVRRRFKERMARRGEQGVKVLDVRCVG